MVSSKRDACDPSWGGAYSLDEAAEQLDLDRRVARLGQLGRRVTVSFGGAANSELAIGCTDDGDLAAAYQSVVDRYSIDTIDLDIEGAEASAPDVVQRRARAIAAVVAAERAAGRHLAVWLTLPVSTTGLTAEGVGILRATLDGGVDPAGVNAMVMDYGVPFEPGATMGDQAESALTALQAQLRDAYAATGPVAVGRPGVAADRCDRDDRPERRAGRGVRPRRRAPAARLRPAAPPPPALDVVGQPGPGLRPELPRREGRVGPVQWRGPGRRRIRRRLRQVRPRASGSDPAAPATTAPAPAVSASASAEAKETDDPARSPYQIWNAEQAYPADTKVVWHHNVYVAKWYSMGELPDAPVADAHLTPWSLVGPVLPGEHPPVTPTLAPGTYPKWRADRVYEGGEKVLRRGIGYQAKWWTQGDPPDADVSSPYDSPWLQLKS